MTSNMLQDTIPSSPPANLGPRFRPYASPNHHVTKGRYITSNDPRGYIPVYEYPLNGQWIMMDIDDGYILWTGIWKALGNSKADIVKMIDSQPDLAPLIRRVRGGYLKIQGTWMPYEVALRLSRRVAWSIRDDLIPLFGPTFPSTCLSPDQPGYGQVVASGPSRRRARRHTHANPSLLQTPRDPQTNWTVVTPNNGGNDPRRPISPMQTSPAGSHPPSAFTSMSNFYSPRDQHRGHDDMTNGTGNRSPSGYAYPAPPRPNVSVIDRHHRQQASDVNTTSSNAGSTRDRAPSSSSSVRYSPYSSHAPHPARRPSIESRGGPLSLDIPSLSLRDQERLISPHNAPNHVHPPSTPQLQHRLSKAGLREEITLPPIRSPHVDQGSGSSQYALPPISALEDLRGLHTHDSAAVLRRLRADEDDYPMGDAPASTKRRRSSGSSHRFSGDEPRSSSSPASIPPPHTSQHPHSRSNSSTSGDEYGDASGHFQYERRERLDESGAYPPHHSPSSRGRDDLRLSVPSDTSHDGLSTCDPSPISPETPRSAASMRGGVHSSGTLGFGPVSASSAPAVTTTIVETAMLASRKDHSSVLQHRRVSESYAATHDQEHGQAQQQPPTHHHYHHRQRSGTDWLPTVKKKDEDDRSLGRIGELHGSDSDRLPAVRRNSADSDIRPHRPW